MAGKEKRSAGQILLRLLFLLYAAAMLWLLFGQRINADGSGSPAGNIGDNLNLIPLKTIKMYLRVLERSTNDYLLRHAFFNLVGNVVLFIPLGFYLPYLSGKPQSFLKCVLCVTGMILVVEAVQYFTLLGSCDVDDLLLNLLGAVIGYVIWWLTARLRR